MVSFRIAVPVGCGAFASGSAGDAEVGAGGVVVEGCLFHSFSNLCIYIFRYCSGPFCLNNDKRKVKIRHQFLLHVLNRSITGKNHE